jgi:hypothetical protein
MGNNNAEVGVYETNGEQLQVMCDLVSEEVICFFT